MEHSVDTGCTGGQDPPPCTRWVQKIVAGMLKNVAHHETYRIERLSTPSGFRYIVQCVHRDSFTPAMCKGGGPVHQCI